LPKPTRETRSRTAPKPTVFIGSSGEQLATAREVKALLRPELDADVWDEGVFGFGNSYLEDLMSAVDRYDFALFVFAPDDLTTMRTRRQPSVRDNVVFELGLFMGRLGRHRAFWLVPRGKSVPKIPSDLDGISRADFEIAPSKRTKALATACRKVKDEARAQGRRTDGNYEELENPRVLCAASAQWAEFGFEDDIDAVSAAFGERMVAEPALEGTALANLLTGGEWPIVHLVCYVDPSRGDLIFSPVRIGPRDKVVVPTNAARLAPEALAELCEQAKVRLLVLATCDSATYIQRLSRSTRVVASPTLVTGKKVGEWARLFYRQLAEGKALSQAFYTAQSVTNIPLVLTSVKKDLLLRT
jgi:predicted nucleotide-binding protein with TIR-like domain